MFPRQTGGENRFGKAGASLWEDFHILVRDLDWSLRSWDQCWNKLRGLLAVTRMLWVFEVTGSEAGTFRR